MSTFATLRSIRRLFGKRDTRFPFRVKITEFQNSGCTFEITTPVEEWRVTRLGDETEFLGLLLRELSVGDVLFDIGSCVGLYALHAGLRGIRVCAFEPDPSYRQRLLKNVALNNLSQSVRVLDWAVSDQVGEASLFTDGVNGGSPSLAEFGSRGTVVVPTDSIDNALATNCFPVPTILKMDIEGAEILALRGMRQLLASEHKPRCMFIELHPQFLAAFNSSVDECTSLIESYGYIRQYFRTRDEQIHCIYTIEANGRG